MPSKNPAQRLRDILENIDAIEAFTAGMAFGEFTRDRKTVYAVTRRFESQVMAQGRNNWSVIVTATSALEVSRVV